jgi:uncharacterized protein (TIGR02466 family)
MGRAKCRQEPVITHHRPLTLSESGFELRQLFPTPVVVAPVNDAPALNHSLRATILAHRARETGVQRSNAGGWQSRDDFAAWSGEDGARLIDMANRLADQLTRVQTDAGLEHISPAWKINAWANVNVSGDANHAHHHPGSFWSGVYWVDAGEAGETQPDGGEFEMLDPRGVLPCFAAPLLRTAVAGCLSAGMSEFLVPRSGTMLLFPSWLVHAVRPYRGKAPRISVAFNFAA